MCTLHQPKNIDTKTDSVREILNVALRDGVLRTQFSKPQSLRMTWARL